MKGITLWVIIGVLSIITILISIKAFNDNGKVNTNSNCINHYIDTINGHIILTTTYWYGVSTLELNNNDTTNIK